MDVLELKGTNSKMLKGSSSYELINTNKIPKRRPPKESFCEFDIIDNYRQKKMYNAKLVKRNKNDGKETEELIKKIKELAQRNVEIEEMHKSSKPESDSSGVVVSNETKTYKSQTKKCTPEPNKKHREHKSRSLIRSQSIEKQYAETEEKVSNQITRLIAMEGNLEKELRNRKSRSFELSNDAIEKLRDSKTSKNSRDSKLSKRIDDKPCYLCKLDTKIMKVDSICKDCSGSNNKPIKETEISSSNTKKHKTKSKKTKSGEGEIIEYKNSDDLKKSGREDSKKAAHRKTEKLSKNSDSSEQKVITVYDNIRALEILSDSCSKDSRGLFLNEEKLKEQKLEANKKNVMSFFTRKKKDDKQIAKAEKRLDKKTKKHKVNNEDEVKIINDTICMALVNETDDRKREEDCIKEIPIQLIAKIDAKKLAKEEKIAHKREKQLAKERINADGNKRFWKRDKSPKEDKLKESPIQNRKKIDGISVSRSKISDQSKREHSHEKEVLFTNDPLVCFFESSNAADQITPPILTNPAPIIKEVKKPVTPKYKRELKQININNQSDELITRNIIQELIQVYKVEKANISGRGSPRTKNKKIIKSSSDEDLKKPLTRKSKWKSTDNSPKLNRKELSFSNLNLLPNVNIYSHPETPLITTTTQTPVNTEKESIQPHPNFSQRFINKLNLKHFAEPVALNIPNNQNLSKTTIALRDINKVAEFEKNEATSRKAAKWLKRKSKEPTDKKNILQPEIISRRELLERLSIKEEPRPPKIPTFLNRFTSKTNLPYERMVEISSKVLQNDQVKFTVEGSEPPTRFRCESKTSRVSEKNNSLKIKTFPGIHMDCNPIDICLLNHGAYRVKLLKPKSEVVELEELLGNKNSLLTTVDLKHKNTCTNLFVMNKSAEDICSQKKTRHEIYINKSVDMFASNSDFELKNKSTQAVKMPNVPILVKDKSVDAVQRNSINVSQDLEIKNNESFNYLEDVPTYEIYRKKKSASKRMNDKRIYADKASESIHHAEVQVCRLHLSPKHPQFNPSEVESSKQHIAFNSHSSVGSNSQSQSKKTFKINEGWMSKMKRKRSSAKRVGKKNHVSSGDVSMEKLSDIQKEIYRAKETIARNLNKISNSLDPLNISDMTQAKKIIAKTLTGLRNTEKRNLNLKMITYTNYIHRVSDKNDPNEQNLKGTADFGTEISNISYEDSLMQNNVIVNSLLLYKNKDVGLQKLEVRNVSTQTHRWATHRNDSGDELPQRNFQHTTSSQIRNELFTSTQHLQIVNQIVYDNFAFNNKTQIGPTESNFKCPCGTTFCPCSTSIVGVDAETTTCEDNSKKNMPISISQILEHPEVIRDETLMLKFLKRMQKNDLTKKAKHNIKVHKMTQNTHLHDKEKANIFTDNISRTEEELTVIDYKDGDNDCSSDSSQEQDKVKNICKQMQIAFRAVFENANVFKTDKEFQDVLQLCDNPEKSLPRKQTSSDIGVPIRITNDKTKISIKRNTKGEAVQTQTPENKKNLTVKNVPVVSKIPISASDSSYPSALQKKTSDIISHASLKPNIQRYRPNAPKNHISDKIRLTAPPKQHRKEIAALEKCLNDILSKLNDERSTESTVAPDSCSLDMKETNTQQFITKKHENRKIEHKPKTTCSKYRTSLSKYHKAKVYSEKLRERAKKRTELQNKSNDTYSNYNAKSSLSINRSSNPIINSPRCKEKANEIETTTLFSINYEKRVKSVFKNNKGFISSATSISSKPSENFEISSSYPKSSPSMQLGVTDYLLNYNKIMASASSTSETRQHRKSRQEIKKLASSTKKSRKKRKQFSTDLKRKIKKATSKLPLYEQLRDFDSIPNIVILSVSSTCTLYRSPSSFIDRIERRLNADTAVADNANIPHSINAGSYTDVQTFNSLATTDEGDNVSVMDKGVISKTPFFIENAAKEVRKEQKDMISSDSLENNCNELCPLTAVFNIKPQSYAYLVYNAIIETTNPPKNVPSQAEPESNAARREPETNARNLTSFAAASGKNTSIVFNEILKPRMHLSPIQPNKIQKRRCCVPNYLSGEVLETAHASFATDIGMSVSAQDNSEITHNDCNSLQIPQNSLEPDALVGSMVLSKSAQLPPQNGKFSTFAEMANSCGNCNNHIILNYRTKCDCTFNNETFNTNKLCTFSDFTNKPVGNNHIITNYINKYASNESVCCNVTSSSSIMINESGYSTTKTNKTSSLMSFFKKGGSLLDIFRGSAKAHRKKSDKLQTSAVSLTVIAENECSVCSSGSTITNTTRNSSSRSAFWFNVAKKIRSPKSLSWNNKNSHKADTIAAPHCHVTFECKPEKANQCTHALCVPDKVPVYLHHKTGDDTPTIKLKQKKNRFTHKTGDDKPFAKFRKKKFEKDYEKSSCECKQYCDKVIMESNLRKEGHLRQYNTFKEIPLDILMGKRMTCPNRRRDTSSNQTSNTAFTKTTGTDPSLSKPQIEPIINEVSKDKKKKKLREYKIGKKKPTADKKAIIKLDDLISTRKTCTKCGTDPDNCLCKRKADIQVIGEQDSICPCTDHAKHQLCTSCKEEHTPCPKDVDPDGKCSLCICPSTCAHQCEINKYKSKDGKKKKYVITECLCDDRDDCMCEKNKMMDTNESLIRFRETKKDYICSCPTNEYGLCNKCSGTSLSVLIQSCLPNIKSFIKMSSDPAIQNSPFNVEPFKIRLPIRKCPMICPMDDSGDNDDEDEDIDENMAYTVEASRNQSTIDESIKKITNSLGDVQGTGSQNIDNNSSLSNETEIRHKPSTKAAEIISVKSIASHISQPDANAIDIINLSTDEITIIVEKEKPVKVNKDNNDDNDYYAGYRVCKDTCSCNKSIDIHASVCKNTECLAMCSKSTGVDETCFLAKTQSSIIDQPNNPNTCTLGTVVEEEFFINVPKVVSVVKSEDVSKECSPTCTRALEDKYATTCRRNSDFRRNESIDLYNVLTVEAPTDNRNLNNKPSNKKSINNKTTYDEMIDIPIKQVIKFSPESKTENMKKSVSLNNIKSDKVNKYTECLKSDFVPKNSSLSYLMQKSESELGVIFSQVNIKFIKPLTQKKSKEKPTKTPTTKLIAKPDDKVHKIYAKSKAALTPYTDDDDDDEDEDENEDSNPTTIPTPELKVKKKCPDKCLVSKQQTRATDTNKNNPTHSENKGIKIIEEKPEKEHKIYAKSRAVLTPYVDDEDDEFNDYDNAEKSPASKKGLVAKRQPLDVIAGCTCPLNEFKLCRYCSGSELSIELQNALKDKKSYELISSDTRVDNKKILLNRTANFAVTPPVRDCPNRCKVENIGKTNTNPIAKKPVAKLPTMNKKEKGTNFATKDKGAKATIDEDDYNNEYEPPVGEPHKNVCPHRCPKMPQNDKTVSAVEEPSTTHTHPKMVGVPLEEVTHKIYAKSRANLTPYNDIDDEDDENDEFAMAMTIGPWPDPCIKSNIGEFNAYNVCSECSDSDSELSLKQSTQSESFDLVSDLAEHKQKLNHTDHFEAVEIHSRLKTKSTTKPEMKSATTMVKGRRSIRIVSENEYDTLSGAVLPFTNSDNKISNEFKNCSHGHAKQVSSGRKYSDSECSFSNDKNSEKSIKFVRRKKYSKSCKRSDSDDMPARCMYIKQDPPLMSQNVRGKNQTANDFKKKKYVKKKRENKIKGNQSTDEDEMSPYKNRLSRRQNNLSKDTKATKMADLKNRLSSIKAEFSKIPSKELIELADANKKNGVPKKTINIKRNLTDKEIFDHLLGKYEKEEEIANKFANDDNFFFEQTATIGMVTNQNDPEIYFQELSNIDHAKKKKVGCRPVEPSDIGTTFSKGFRADNIILNGDACYSINKQDKVHITPHLTNPVESIIDFSERETPIDFMLAIGYTVDEASNALKDDDIRGRLLAAITEARVWINKITSIQGILLYLVAYKARPETMRYFLQLVEAIINKRIGDAIKLDGFLRILEKVETSEIKMEEVLGDTQVVPIDTIRDEQALVNLLIEMFKMVYTSAQSAARTVNKNANLSTRQGSLLKKLTNEYTMELHNHMEFLSHYIGRDQITTEKQLSDAITYLVNAKEAKLDLYDFENTCNITTIEEKTIKNKPLKHIFRRKN